MLEYRRLGRTDLKVSSIMLGTMTWGQQNTEAEGHAQLDLALDAGINFIDTAELYSIPPMAETQGSTERIIGQWFKSRKNRDKVILASKVVGRSDSTYFRASGEGTKLDRANITEAVENSLKRLQTDYIDLYQLHWPDRAVPLFGNSAGTRARGGGDGTEVPVAETLGVLEDLVKAGKIRHIGLSNETAWGAHKFLLEAERGHGPRIVSVQNAYNLINRTYEVGLAEFAERDDVGLLAYSPLAQGFLTGKYRQGARPEGARMTLFNRGQRYEKPGTAEAIEDYAALAKELGLSLVQLSLAWVTSRPFVTANIIGATSIAQLKENLATVDVAITQEIEEKVNAIFQLRGSPAP
ncbi:putative oxidoreductase [Azorhizobium caulinodans ORS 571]|uniref:Putative oxidoreductase n=1 Tax=Azorhizobium caulinodans (strain ATCC 43989 / DSM 5975 / JCM 20966 / LMG 6465 / NBRC 14845 / NCIMB 13405 / ORS 571) TaxID=438753 RepID=A8IDT2_AZOC5|nr:aldo/keto reductase [Azorhizobium caulinodans]BAF88987.1 putative oxidoreductase [Azorhizobium caulinodans ORS 571]